MDDTFAFPLRERPERLQILRWWAEEDTYIADKFSGGIETTTFDESLRRTDLDAHWVRSVTMYYDRARLFAEEASNLEREGNHVAARRMRKKALQAVAKGMTTALSFTESAVRVWGTLPKPGMPSGEIAIWAEVES